jgi:hypothetical protein
MKGQRLNDDERRLWILNDEGLYLWQRLSGLPMRAFIRKNRVDLDKTIREALGESTRQ